MKIGTMALIGGAMVAALAGMGVVACSSSNGNGNPSNPVDGSVSPGNDGAVTPGNDGATPGDDGATSGDAGTGGDTSTTPVCKTAPVLKPNPAGAVFCGYPPDGGSGFDCDSDGGGGPGSGGGGLCCLGGSLGGGTYAPEQCQAWPASGTAPACTNPVGKGIPVECAQISDCTANGVTGAACCLAGATAAADAGCGFTTYSSGTSVLCEVADGGAAGGDAGDAGTASGTPSCATGEIQICSSQADCPSGKTCTPMKWKIYDLGYCL